MSISIDTLIGDDENSTIGDMIADDFNIEKEYTDCYAAIHSYRNVSILF